MRIAAAGVCHSDLHLADGHLGARPPADRARPRGRRRRRGGRRGRRARRARATASRSASSPPAAAAARCRAGQPNLCEPAGEQASAGTLMDGTSRLRCTGRHGRCSTSSRSRASPSAPSWPRPRVVPLPDDLPLWQAALVGCGVVTGSAPCATSRRRRAWRQRRRDRLRRRGHAGHRRASARRRRSVIALDRDPAMLELARATAPRTPSTRGRRRACRRARAHRRRRRPRLRGRRPARDDPPGVRDDPRGRHRGRGRHRAAGRRRADPRARPHQRQDAARLLLRIGNVLAEMPAVVGMVASGRLG